MSGRHDTHTQTRTRTGRRARAHGTGRGRRTAGPWRHCLIRCLAYTLQAAVSIWLMITLVDMLVAQVNTTILLDLAAIWLTGLRLAGKVAHETAHARALNDMRDHPERYPRIHAGDRDYLFDPATRTWAPTRRPDAKEDTP